MIPSPRTEAVSLAMAGKIMTRIVAYVVQQQECNSSSEPQSGSGLCFRASFCGGEISGFQDTVSDLRASEVR